MTRFLQVWEIPIQRKDTIYSHMYSFSLIGAVRSEVFLFTSSGSVNNFTNQTSENKLFRDARKYRLSDEQHRIGARRSRVGFERAPRLGNSGAGQRADLHHCGGCFGQPVSHHFGVQESETEKCW